MPDVRPDFFSRHESTKAAYDAVIDYVAGLPGSEIEVKKTCIHVAAGKGAFLGVHPRKHGVRLTIPLARDLESPRVVKSLRSSANRCYHEVDVSSDLPLDDVVKEWVREAYQLKAQKN